MCHDFRLFFLNSPTVTPRMFWERLKVRTTCMFAYNNLIKIDEAAIKYDRDSSWLVWIVNETVYDGNVLGVLHKSSKCATETCAKCNCINWSFDTMPILIDHWMSRITVNIDVVLSSNLFVVGISQRQVKFRQMLTNYAISMYVRKSITYVNGFEILTDLYHLHFIFFIFHWILLYLSKTYADVDKKGQ